MGIKASDLNPAPSEVELRGKMYRLKKFSLSKRIWATEKFGTKENPNGLMNAGEALSKFGSPECFKVVSTMLYELLEDKSDFSDAENVLDALAEKTKFTKLGIAFKALNKCIGISQSQTDELANEIEAKKFSAMAPVL